MGGEKLHQPMRVRIQFGSPPRGRGKGHAAFTGVLMGGITPAWAGKSGFLPCIWPINWDHPRVGGEKPYTRRIRRRRRGSPPRGRGKVAYTARYTTKKRITPAWAGKRKNSEFTGHQRKDHPRVGGEKRFLISFAVRNTGSPPRGRGKVRCAIILPPYRGITPAWAGKRFPGSAPAALPGDHPRVGGEKTKKIP